jgi:acetyl esterase
MAGAALHPQVAAMLKTMQESGLRPLPECTIEEARERSRGRRLLLGSGPPVSEVRALRIPGADGEIRARHYVPLDEPRGLLIYLHGGGWTLGDIDDYDALCQMMAVECGVSVLSVDYRLAPEHPFPAGLEDARAALGWAAAELAGGEPIVLAGDSAGANLAAVCARLATEAGAPQIALQVLVYPVCDHDFTRHSYDAYGSGYALGRPEMVWFWDHYLPDAAARDDPRASPLRATDLAGLPPALVMVAEYDPLRDEALAYAERLAAADVPVTVRLYDDVMHGFFTMATFLERGDEAVAEVGRAVRAVTRPESAGAAQPQNER